jgi:hypothetical protein
MDIYDPNMTEDQMFARMVGVLDHEFVHHLQRSGAFSQAEWKQIVKYLQNNQAYGRDGSVIKGQTWWERARDQNPREDGESDAEYASKIARARQCPKRSGRGRKTRKQLQRNRPAFSGASSRSSRRSAGSASLIPASSRSSGRSTKASAPVS